MGDKGQRCRFQRPDFIPQSENIACGFISHCYQTRRTKRKKTAQEVNTQSDVIDRIHYKAVQAHIINAKAERKNTCGYGDPTDRSSNPPTQKLFFEFKKKKLTDL